MLATKNYALIPFILVLAMAGAELATDLYIPSLPAIADFFGTTDKVANLTLSLNLLGVAIARPFYGFLCDCYGRRSVMLLGTVILLVSTLFCVAPPNMNALIISRFFQGVGEAVGWVVGLAIMRDVYKDRESYTRVMSVMRAVMAVFPAIGPMLGAFIADIWNWQATFVFMAFFSLVILGFVFFKLPETLAVENRHQFSVRNVARNYWTILRNRVFLGNVLISALGFAGIWVFISASPIMYIEHFGFSRQEYSYFLFAGVFAYFLGSLYNRHFIYKFSTEQFLMQGLILLIVASSLMLVTVLIDPMSPYLIRLFSGMYMGAMAMVFTSTALKALEVFPSMSGSASALMGGLEWAIASTLVFTLREFLEHAELAASIITFGVALTCLLIHLGVEKKSSRNLA